MRLKKTIGVLILSLMSCTVVSAQTLSGGMAGSAVLQLQNDLINAGYFARTPDGCYGSSTAKAVALFEKDHGLTVNGVADDSVQSAIAGLAGKTYRNGGGVVMAIGNYGSDVQQCQQVLKSNGYLSGDVDGNFGPETEKAVRWFQRDQGLPVSGVIDEETLSALNPGGYSGAADSSAASSDSSVPSSGTSVIKLQNLLLLHGYNPGIVDGRMGSDTEGAVAQLQHFYGMRETGIPDSQVWQKLQDAPVFMGNYRKVLSMQSTAYTPNDSGETGFTADGSYAGKGHAAVDPGVIPLGTLLYVEGYGYAVADDVGGSITGKRIDLGVDTLDQAYRWGTKNVKVYVVS